MTKKQSLEQQEAIERLKEWIKPGDTIYTILRHTSRSGMQRVIHAIKLNDAPDPDRSGPYHLSWNVSKALGWTFSRSHEGVRVDGCGMDMGFHLVYALSHTLFPEGFECIGEGCPSNDHSNGDRSKEPHMHSDGGYALKQRWL